VEIMEIGGREGTCLRAVFSGLEVRRDFSRIGVVEGNRSSVFDGLESDAWVNGERKLQSKTYLKFESFLFFISN
jgi:hypothetical protein